MRHIVEMVSSANPVIIWTENITDTIYLFQYILNLLQESSNNKDHNRYRHGNNIQLAIQIFAQSSNL